MGFEVLPVYGRAQRPFRGRQEVFLSHAIVSCSGPCDRSANSYGKFKFTGRFVIVELLHISITERRNLYHSLASRKKILCKSILCRNFKLSPEDNFHRIFKTRFERQIFNYFRYYTMKRTKEIYTKYILFFFFKLYKYLFNEFTIILESNTL